MKFKIQIGQTLLETMIALVLIGLGVLALIKFQNYLAYENSLVQQKADATMLSVKQIETLRNFQTLKTTSGFNAYNDISSGTSTVSGVTTTYTLTWTVVTNTNPDYKQINMTTTWQDRYGTNQSISLTTNIAESDPAYSAAIM